MKKRNYIVAHDETTGKPAGGFMLVPVRCDIGPTDAVAFHALGVGGQELREILASYVDKVAPNIGDKLVKKAIKAREENGKVLGAWANKIKITRQLEALQERLSDLPDVSDEDEAALFG